jgi:hypothetical protein
MKRYRIVLKAVSILFVLLFSFFLPAFIIPKVDSAFTLSEIERNLVQNFLAALPTFLALISYAVYHNVEYVYVIVNRFWMWISNTSVSWSLSAEYIGIQANEIDNIYRAIIDKYDDAEPVQNQPIAKLINLHKSIRGMIRLTQIDSAESDQLLDDENKFVVSVFNLRVPFRDSESALDELNYLFSNIIEKQIHPTETEYTFRINFEANNPYYGLFIRKEKIHAQDIVSFNCAFVDRRGHSEGHVSVSNKRLSLVTQSSTDFRALSKRYVSFAMAGTS